MAKIEEPAAIAVISDASSPLGRALSLALAQRGVTVAGISRSRIEPDHALFHAVVADVSAPQQVARAFDEIRSQIGAPTILINNAEIFPRRDILDETPASFMETLQFNLGGAFYCCHAVLPTMVTIGRGRIINVVPPDDIAHAPMAAGYQVSKGAMRILTRSLMVDLGDRFPGIIINDWVPGTREPRKGIADGVDPSLAAEWGASLALRHTPEINGLEFFQDRERKTARSFKRRLKERLLRTS